MGASSTYHVAVVRRHVTITEVETVGRSTVSTRGPADVEAGIAVARWTAEQAVEADGVVWSWDVSQDNTSQMLDDQIVEITVDDGASTRVVYNAKAAAAEAEAAEAAAKPHQPRRSRRVPATTADATAGSAVAANTPATGPTRRSYAEALADARTRTANAPVEQRELLGRYVRQAEPAKPGALSRAIALWQGERKKNKVAQALTWAQVDAAVKDARAG